VANAQLLGSLENDVIVAVQVANLDPVEVAAFV
jgi:hypothetical protein